MTELQMIERARMYLDKLAKGINPIDGTEVADTDVVNNVRISRCLFFVTEVLDKVIENGGTEPPQRPLRRSEKAPFALTLEQRDRCLFTEEGTSVTVLAQRLNDLIDGEVMQPIKYGQITDWLVDAGLLEVITTAEGHHIKRATEEGTRLGIFNEDRQGAYGSYTAVVYSLQAQHFVVDNLDSILSFSAKKFEMEGMPWTPEQNEQLRELFRQGLDNKEIAARLCRKTNSVKQQLKKIGPQ